MWVLLFGLGRDLTQFSGIYKSEALFYLEFPGVTFGLKKYVLNPAAFFIWNSPTHSMFDPKNWTTSSTQINITVYCGYIQNNLIFQNNLNRNITLYVLVMSRTRFRVNPHSIVAWISRNSLLEAGAKSEGEVTGTGLEPRTT